MSLDQYNYELPKELIAQQPLRNKTDARLLVVDRSRGDWQHHHIRDLPELLSADDALVVNDTRVLPARLVGHRTQTMGRWQGLYLAENEHGHWKILSRTRGHLKVGETVTLHDREARDALQLRLLASLGGGLWVAQPLSDQATTSLLNVVGRVPLPPYVRGGEMVARDMQDYQTVFATHAGAVAAPTAGLHFTQPLLDAIQQRGTAVCPLTLHVGIGTFRPIATDAVQEHKMHSEWACLSGEAVELLRSRRAKGGRIVAVGTTAVRTLETAAQDGELAAWSGDTDLFIYPPYTFRAVDALLTNFHLPKTTLLVLVSAFTGHQLLRAAYQEAIEQQYRFYSYGDAMLIV